MKRKLLFLLVTLWCSWAGAEASVYAQRRITINLSQATAEQVLNTLKGSTGYEFFYRVDDLADVPRRDYLFTDATIQQVMGRLAENAPILWSVRDNTVTISRQRGAQAPATGVVTGRVVDQQGQPLIGATVVITGSQRGVITDANGRFEFDNVPGNSTRVTVSYVGMTTREVTMNVGQTVTITLEASAEIETVVVTGLFNRPGESFTGAAKVINAEDLKRVGGTNLFQSLRNLDPSINLIDNLAFGSDPNRLPEIELRGQSTFPMSEEDINLKRMYQDSPNQPLYILDGFEVSATRIFDLDMERIENVTLLKDASAKAIYGIKAANGVFVIETKRNSGDRLRTTYRGSVDIETPDLTSYDLTNAMEKLQVELQGGLYDSGNIANVAANMKIYNDRLNRALAGTDTDWLSKPLRMGIGTRHALNVDMSDDNLSVMGDVAFSNVTGTMKGSKRNTISASMEVSYRNAGKFQVRNQMSIVSNNSTDSPWGGFSEYAAGNPYDDPYDEYGNLVWGFLAPNGQDGGYERGNPMYNTQFNTSFTDDYFLFEDWLQAEYFPMEGMIMRLRGGFSTQRDNAEDFYPSYHTMFGDENDPMKRGQFISDKGRRDQLSADLSLMYNKTWNEVHLVTANFAYTVSESRSHQVKHKAEGFPSDKMDDILFARRYATESHPEGYESVVRDMGFTGLLSYSYDSRYMADFSIRAGASSLYSPKKRWGSFWSFGLRWNISQEKWAENWTWMDRMLVRGSIGTSGSQNIEAYSHMVTYNYITDRFYNMGVNNSSGFGSNIVKLANEDLKWQLELQNNIGFEATLWKRLSLVFDYYHKTTHDLVSDFTLPSSTGFVTVKENIGNVVNKGIELTLTYRLIDRNDFYVNLTGALATNNNKIVKLSDAMREYNDRQNALFGQFYEDDGETPKGLRQAPVLKYVEGGSMSTIWTVQSLGIDPMTGQEVFMGRNGLPTYIYSASDQVATGDKKEKYRGNFGFNGEWKGLGMSVICRFIAGGQLYNQTLVSRVENVDISKNVDRRVFTGRWSEDNRYAPYKALRIWDASRNGWVQAPNTQPSSRFVQDRNDLTIAALSVYYNLDRLRVIKNMGLSRLRLAFNMNDLHTFSTIKIERGTEYPFARKMSFSLTAEF